jgi:hypothetical protein
VLSAVNVGVVSVALPVASNTMVLFPPPSTAYVTVAFAVPLNDIKAFDPEQIAVVPEIAAVGNAFIDTIADPVCSWLQLFKVTLTNA